MKRLDNKIVKSLTATAVVGGGIVLSLYAITFDEVRKALESNEIKQSQYSSLVSDNEQSEDIINITDKPEIVQQKPTLPEQQPIIVNNEPEDIAEWAKWLGIPENEVGCMLMRVNYQPYVIQFRQKKKDVLKALDFAKETSNFNEYNNFKCVYMFSDSWLEKWNQYIKEEYINK